MGINKEENSKTRKKKNVGITLIALIITVIILLILAGVNTKFSITEKEEYLKQQNKQE